MVGFLIAILSVLEIGSANAATVLFNFTINVSLNLFSKDNRVAARDSPGTFVAFIVCSVREAILRTCSMLSGLRGMTILGISGRNTFKAIPTNHESCFEPETNRHHKTPY